MKPDSNQEPPEGIDRRTFIQGAAATSVAAVGLPEVFQPAAAQTDSPLQYLGQTGPAAVYEFESGDWSQVGEDLTGENGSVTKLARYDGDLFTGVTTDTPIGEGAGQVYRLDDESWRLVGDGLENNVCTLDVFDGDLYAGTAFGSANLYRYEGDNEWNRVVDHTDWDGISAAYVWEETLFVGDSRYDKYGYFDGESLTVEQPEAVGSCVYDFVDYEGELYGGNYSGVLRARGEEGSWATVDEADAGGLLELETFDGDMYVGAEGGTLYRWRSADEGLVNEHDFRDSIVALQSGGNALYIGIGHNAAEFDDSFPREAPGYLYRYRDGIATQITDVEFGNGVQELRLTGYSLLNPRFVQWVENTRVVDDNRILHREPDPDLVAGSNASVVLDVEPPIGDVPEASDLPSTVGIEVTREYTGSRGPQTDVFTLSDEIFHEVLDEDDLLNWIGILTDDTWPVFELTSDLESVTIELAPTDSSIQATPATVSPPNQLRTTPTLRVGFIPVADGLFGANYGSETQVQLDPHQVNGGFPLNYQSTVDEAIEYLEEMFPTSEVRAYRHDRAIRGTTTAGKNGSDASTAHTELQKLVSGSSQISQSETVNGRGPISEFDETIGIVPTREPGGNNTFYFDFHNECEHDKDGDIVSCTIGVKFGNPSASLVTEAGELRPLMPLDENDAAEINAHELGHHFLGFSAYGDPAGDPMAQRDDTDGDSQPDSVDQAHARQEHSLDSNDDPGVRLRKFALADGTFFADDETASLMSYSWSAIWPDSRMIQLLIDGQFDADYQTSSNYVGSLVAGILDLTEEGITFRSFTESSGYAMPADDSGAVTLSVIDADGGSLETITTTTDLVGIPDGQEDDFSQDRPPQNRIVKEDTVLFALPFPEEAVAVEAAYAGSTTRVVPHSRLLAEAIRTVPDEGFVRNPEQLRGALLNKVDSFESQIETDAYTGALQRLRNDIQEHVREWVRDDYGAFANQYTRTELLALIDDVAGRLEGLSDRGQGRTGSGSGR